MVYFVGLIEDLEGDKEVRIDPQLDTNPWNVFCILVGVLNEFCQLCDKQKLIGRLVISGTFFPREKLIN